MAKQEEEMRFYPNQRFIDARGRKFTIMGAWMKGKDFKQVKVEFVQDNTTEVVERPVPQIIELFKLGRLVWIEENPKEIFPPLTINESNQ